jgi:hypothetical protein
LVDAHPHVVVIKPSWVDTPAVASFDVIKLPTTRVAEIVLYVLTSPVRILDITFEQPLL